ncbi:PepSY domain-containing protein [Nonomuraea cavernae]|uniref:PepSY domain-containing protein n=1 Tax=Nonomuraea cavernae TaxID=2045107 RepID=A0A918DIH9_9ACTN|nr:PepSY domain-containing protein [Nonomuraea cavernae]MCA2185334.1 PepSY domain-containing protein [Nonomuraea cavernae]GGO66148.1 hypothetical protein GCM10012289_19470 [Nonomuraea cavernae]
MRITNRVIAVGTGIVFLIAGGSTAVAVAATSATAPPVAPKVTAEQAIKIAHDQVPGGWIDDVSLDRDDSKTAKWEVDLVKGDVEHEFDLDATSGKVLKHETAKATASDDSDDSNDSDDD